jgi:hypothetical protein
MVLVYLVLNTSAREELVQELGDTLVAPPLALQLVSKTVHKGLAYVLSPNDGSDQVRDFVFAPDARVVGILEPAGIQVEYLDHSTVEAMRRVKVYSSEDKHLVRIWFDTAVTTPAMGAVSTVKLDPAEGGQR